jgi:outer membrane protein TolC
MRWNVQAGPLASAVVILTLCCGLVSFARPATAAETTITLNSVGSAPVDLTAPLSFMDTVKVALARSQALRSTQITIETAKLAEKDVWYKLFPKLVMNVNYNAPVLKDKESTTNYKESISLGFSTGPYDPLVAYFSHDASKSAVKLAELGHVIAIEELMGKVALIYLNINAAKKDSALYRELVTEMESLERYAAKKEEAGTIASLDHKLAEQNLLLARMELSKATRTQELLRRTLKRLIGLEPQDNVVFNTDNADKELTGSANAGESLRPEAIARNNNLLRAEALKVKLEGYSINLAKADHIPKFNFGFTTPDPMSNQGGHLPYYVTLGASIPIWSWGETLRASERAELKHQDEKIREKLLLRSIQQSVDDLRTAIETAQESTTILETMADLEKLEALRKEIAFNAGSVPYEDLITARQKAIKKRLDAAKAQLTQDEARVKLKLVTGNLFSDYIRVDYGELEKN